MKQKGHKDLRAYRRAARKMGWDQSYFHGQRIDTYYAPDLIYELFAKPLLCAFTKNNNSLSHTGPVIIGDFGSGNGVAMQILRAQLTRQLGDRRILSLGIEKDREALNAMKVRAPDVRPIYEDLKTLSATFRPEFFDAGVLRFVLFLNSRSDQRDVLKQIYEVMKEDSILVILNYGVVDTQKAKYFDAFFFRSWESLSQKKIQKENYMLSLRDLKVIAKQVGFTVQSETDLTKSVFGCASAKNLIKEDKIHDRITEAWNLKERRGLRRALHETQRQKPAIDQLVVQLGDLRHKMREARRQSLPLGQLIAQRTTLRRALREARSQNLSPGLLMDQIKAQPLPPQGIRLDWYIAQLLGQLTAQLWDHPLDQRQARFLDQLLDQFQAQRQRHGKDQGLGQDQILKQRLDQLLALRRIQPQEARPRSQRRDQRQNRFLDQLLDQFWVLLRDQYQGNRRVQRTTLCRAERRYREIVFEAWKQTGELLSVPNQNPAAFSLSKYHLVLMKQKNAFARTLPEP